MEKLPRGYTADEAVMLGRISFHGWFGPENDADREAVRSALSAVGLEGWTTGWSRRFRAAGNSG